MTLTSLLTFVKLPEMENSILSFNAPHFKSQPPIGIFGNNFIFDVPKGTIVTMSPFLRWCCSHWSQSPTTLVLAGACQQGAQNDSSRGPMKILERNRTWAAYCQSCSIWGDDKSSEADKWVMGEKWRSHNGHNGEQIPRVENIERRFRFFLFFHFLTSLVLYLHLLCSSKSRHPQPPLRPLRLSAQREGPREWVLWRTAAEDLYTLFRIMVLFVHWKSTTPPNAGLYCEEFHRWCWVG